MDLSRPTVLNKIGKRLSRPLSKLICNKLLFHPARILDAYLNILMGKGSGTGWDIDGEIGGALSCISRSKPVIFDVGANVGEWSYLLKKALPDSTLFQFEPSPTCHPLIQKRNLSHTKLFPVALGENKGTIMFHYSTDADVSASIHKRGDTSFKSRTYQEIEVAIDTLDNVIFNNEIEFVDFIKIDAEGHELFILRGAEESFKQRRIGAFSFEFGSSNVNSRTYFRDFWEILNSAGFSIHRVTPGGRLLSIDEYYEDLEFFRGATNYIAILNNHPFAQD